MHLYFATEKKCTHGQSLYLSWEVLYPAASFSDNFLDHFHAAVSASLIVGFTENTLSNLVMPQSS